MSCLSPEPAFLETGDAGVTPVAAEPARLGEFGGGAVLVADQRIGRGQPGMRTGQTRVCAARPFQPEDRLVNPRLQQVDHADPPIPIRQPRIARTEADRLLLRRDRFLDPARQELAYPEIGDGDHPVAIGGDRDLVFRDGRLISLLGAQKLRLGEMGERGGAAIPPKPARSAARPGRYPPQPFRKAGRAHARPAPPPGTPSSRSRPGPATAPFRNDATAWAKPSRVTPFES